MPTKKAAKKVAKKSVAKKAVKKAVAKKTVAKKAAKKTPAKKATNKSLAKKSLVYAPDTASFWVQNGDILNSLVALRDALNKMEKEVYRYHAKGAHNDFANWVGAVLCDEQCAKDLEKAKTPATAKTVVVKHLKYYAI